MEKKLTTFFYLCICLFCLNTQIASAQGKKGNTITFDSHNCTELQSNSASTWFSFLRHNQAPIQILNANPTANSNTVTPLQGDNNGNPIGNGIFANGSIANNMAFSTTNGALEFYNFYRSHDALCFAIIAPKGYRFTEYWMDIRSTEAVDRYKENVGASNAVITRYSYNEGSTTEYTVASDESMTLSGVDSEIFTHTLSNASNILYFRVTFAQTQSQSCVHMNNLRLTYVIDEEFEATIPNSSNENQVRTGILNLGDFKSVGTTYAFMKENVTDLEDVNIVAESGSTQMSINNGVINVPAGTYWIESPAKFRILGAKLNFQHSAEVSTISYEALDGITGFESGAKYLIKNNKESQYLNAVTTGVGKTKLQSSATIWTITKSGDEYTIYSETDGKYMILNWEQSSVFGYYSTSISGVTTSTTADTWNYSEEYQTFYKTIRYRNAYSTDEKRTYYLVFSGGSWTIKRDNFGPSYDFTLLPITFEKQVITTLEGSDYSATVYGADGTSVAGTASVSTTEVPIEVTGLNNDGIKFSVNGDAGFTVNLTLLPLDPALQNLEFDYINNSNEESGNRVSASATNFKFKNGETIVMPIEPGVNNPQVVFRNAFNENRTTWYDGAGSGEKVSNYYLIDSEYEKNNAVTPVPDAKVNANQAGTTEIEFSNIKQLTNNGGTLKETVFNKNNAGYENIYLTTTPKTIYIYSADKPEYCIMTAAGKNVNNHIAYTFYDAKLQGVELEETPVITVEKLYTSSLKRGNVKIDLYNRAMNKEVSVANDNDTDTQHTFYGVKVTSNHGYGYLTSAQICEYIKAVMASQEGIYPGDVMRSILYIDMSELKSISGGTETWVEIMLGTADNCLFFMPSGFSISQSMIGGGIIAGGENGTAVTDIIINDQQPFYSPYKFYTSTHVAHYERSQTKASGGNETTDKPTVVHSTLVLPFTMKLNANGNLKPTSDSEDTKLTFYNLTGIQEGGVKADQIVAAPVSTGEATANTPYHIKSTEKTETTSFVIEAQGVTFAKTPLTGYAHDLTSSNGLTAHGTFYGVSIPVSENILYFSKDYFLNSANLTNGATNIKILPYRVYYTAPAPLPAPRYSVLFIDNPDNDDESVVSEDGGFVDAINSLENENEKKVWYNMNGQKINGQPTLPGIYVVNGKKVIVKQ